MRPFSERLGYSATREALQVESMDSGLKTGLWNALFTVLPSPDRGNIVIHQVPQVKRLIQAVWNDFFKLAFDTLPSGWSYARKRLSEMYSRCSWYEVYDLVEFVYAHSEGEARKRLFGDEVNRVLERDGAGYRLVAGRVTPITNEAELDAIASTVASGGPVGEHIQNALRLLSDRESPDYRNSVKEASSALEAAVRGKIDAEGLSLGVALKRLQPSLELHPALWKAIGALYGYASDESGVRHALRGAPDEGGLGFAEAKFMLVTCSALANYLLMKPLDQSA